MKKQSAEQKKNSWQEVCWQNDKNHQNQSAALSHGLLSIRQEKQPVSKIAPCTLITIYTLSASCVNGTFRYAPIMQSIQYTCEQTLQQLQCGRAGYALHLNHFVFGSFAHPGRNAPYSISIKVLNGQCTVLLTSKTQALSKPACTFLWVMSSLYTY